MLYENNHFINGSNQQPDYGDQPNPQKLSTQDSAAHENADQIQAENSVVIENENNTRQSFSDCPHAPETNTAPHKEYAHTHSQAYQNPADYQAALDMFNSAEERFEYSPTETAPQKSKKAKEKKNFTFTKKSVVAVTSLCLVLSLAVGFGGGYVASKFNNSSSGSSVIYQNVTNTSTNNSDKTDTSSIANVAATASESVVEITTETVSTGNRMQQAISSGAGSGVIITTDGYIVTNNHVIENANKITIRLKNGDSYDATLVGADSKTDIAVLKINATNLQPVVFGNSSDLKVGEPAVAIGNPLGQLGGTVTSGIISALDRDITIDGKTMTLLQTNAAINPGNSGGGLFNAQGELVGIVVAKSSGTGIEGLGFAIPIDTAKDIIQQLSNYGYVKNRVYLGLSLVDIDSAQSAMMYRVQQTGLYVTSVQSGSNAEKAGFAAGDCILAVDGTQVTSSSDLNKILDSHKVGDILKFTIARQGQTMDINATLGEYVPSGQQQ